MNLFWQIMHKDLERKIKRHFRSIFRLILPNLLLLISAGCQSSKINPQQSAEEFATYLNQRIPQLMKQYDIPGVSMVLVQNAEVIWSGAYGYADIERKRHMTTDAVCRVESISKSVTTWGVMRLVEQGLLGLDEPVQKYLPDFKLPQSELSGQQITVRRLLSGNAGLALGTIGKSVEYTPGSSMPTLRDFLMQEMRLIREPGSGFFYSNVGFNLLELLIEEVTDRDFAVYMEEEVLAPLGMNHSSFAWQERFHPAIPTGYELNGTAVPPYVYPARASGGLLATTEDIARFVCAGMSGTHVKHGVLKPESVAQIQSPQVAIPGLFGFVADHYGFGHFIETFSDGRKAVWHGGQGHGWMTHFHAIPESGSGIVILTNSQRSWPFMAQVLTDWSHWLGLEPVKMGRITILIKALWVFIGLVILISLLQAYRLIVGLRNGSRSFAPFSPEYLVLRSLQFVFGIIVSAALIWSAAQPYLFISSIFPQGVMWVGISLLAFAVVCITSACFARRRHV